MDFEKLEVWRRGKDLSVAMYRALADCPDYGFRNQLTRSALSVPSNIAEGMERAGNAEKRYFLNVAKGSCAEVRTQLMVGQEIEYMDAACAALWIEETRELSRMLTGLINRITE
ncbi:four helix bundle protein [Pseudomonas neustonica]|uniref:Four helix bundle protein n=1 Tax=Pseudomonas neustonica TaxID=2487346 RepID=A0ABX9XJ25_9PSED|nr:MULTISPECIES: four helix bundle protein [Pseudomonas]ROZ83597.1 four helix bundle protein [Pseudomonas sp. SSM44]ROZ85455.1 four helix bundle protein [Pseudomonas neustonica]|tara:strand:+ start:303 stop:644 length:342 start_codon:yes stop_codon:yes gene_type:complete